MWIFVGFLFSSGLPGSGWRVLFLKAFGASVGVSVVIKPRVRVKFPWKLRLGDHCWIGESVWIDNIDVVQLGNHVCISQGAYLCTGSHDWTKDTFDLLCRPIFVNNFSWLCAFSRIAPGITIGEAGVVGFGEICRRDVPSYHVLTDGKLRKRQYSSELIK